ncbi:helix-turn-helix transcriptional regulator [Oscillospiraceae bacterium 50-16]
MNAIELKVARTRKGFTQEYVASCLGISTVGYSKKERGESGFSPEQITAVARVLEMDQDQVNTIFFDGQLPKSNSSPEKLPPGDSPGVEAPCT